MKRLTQVVKTDGKKSSISNRFQKGTKHMSMDMAVQDNLIKKQGKALDNYSTNTKKEKDSAVSNKPKKVVKPENSKTTQKKQLKEKQINSSRVKEDSNNKKKNNLNCDFSKDEKALTRFKSSSAYTTFQNKEEYSNDFSKKLAEEINFKKNQIIERLNRQNDQKKKLKEFMNNENVKKVMTRTEDKSKVNNHNNSYTHSFMGWDNLSKIEEKRHKLEEKLRALHKSLGIEVDNNVLGKSIKEAQLIKVNNSKPINSLQAKKKINVMTDSYLINDFKSKISEISNNNGVHKNNSNILTNKDQVNASKQNTNTAQIPKSKFSKQPFQGTQKNLTKKIN